MNGNDGILQSGFLNGGVNTIVPAPNQVFYSLNTTWLPDGGEPALGYSIVASGTYTAVIPSLFSLFAFSGSVCTELYTGKSYTASVQFSAPSVAAWQNQLSLILDPSAGYLSFSSGTFNLISSSILGYSLQTFMGSVWYITPTKLGIVYSAPGSYTDFSPLDGGGAVLFSDNYLNQGLQQLLPTQNVLFAIGSNAIYEISFLGAWGSIASLPSVRLVNNQIQTFGYNSTLYNGSAVIGGSNGIMQLTNQGIENLSLPVFRSSINMVGISNGMYKSLYPYLLVCAFYTSPDYVINSTYPYLFVLIGNAWSIINYNLPISYISPPDVNGNVYAISGTNIIKLFSSSYLSQGYFAIKSQFQYDTIANPIHTTAHVYASYPIQIQCNGIQMNTNTIVLSNTRYDINLIGSTVWVSGTNPVSFTNSFGNTVAWLSPQTNIEWVFKGDIQSSYLNTYQWTIPSVQPYGIIKFFGYAYRMSRSAI